MPGFIKDTLLAIQGIIESRADNSVDIEEDDDDLLD